MSSAIKNLRNKVTVRCPAKINLTFDILGIRDDGFHDLETIFQSISLEDEISLQLEESSANEITLSCEDPFIRKLIPLDSSNLISKAFYAFLNRLDSSKKYRAKVNLDKRIPVGAGLAGGSANAAAMLLALNHCFSEPLSQKELLELGLDLGSDVPFCLLGGTAIGRGRGEQLEHFERKLDLSLCIVKPLKLSVSTPWAFRLFDEKGCPRNIDMSISRVKQGLEDNDLEMLISGLGNVFQSVVFEAHPELKKLRDELLELGVYACHMTGSGPTLFAISSGRLMGHHIRRQILKDDDIGFYYGTDDVLRDVHPPIDFHLAEAVSHGPHIISKDSD